MSWLRIDDGFEDHGKVETLSDAAHRLWMRAACWCKKAANQHTNGFIPTAKLRTVSKNLITQAKAEELAMELVCATGEGVFEQGLWIPEEGGFRFHDWEDYQPEEEALTRAEAGRIGGIRSAESRKEKLGTAQPGQPPKQVPKQSPKQTDELRDELPKDASGEATRSSRSPVPVPVPKPGEETRDISSSSAESKARAESRDPRKNAEVIHIFECWKRSTGRTRVRLDAKRARRIKARFAEGFTVSDLEAVLANWRNDRFLSGEDPRSPRVYDGIETLFRDAAQVERLRDLTSRHTSGSAFDVAMAEADRLEREEREANAGV